MSIFGYARDIFRTKRFWELGRSMKHCTVTLARLLRRFDRCSAAHQRFSTALWAFGRYRCLGTALASLVGLLLGLSGSLQGQTEIRFERDIRPVLSDKCFHCHGPDENDRRADLRLDIEGAAKEYAVVPGDSAASALIERILSTDHGLVMPPPEAKKPLSDSEKELLRRWVDEGATWTQHWSFSPIAMPPVPDVEIGSRVSQLRSTNPIDAFVHQRLKDEQLMLSPKEEAERSELIRRVTFDLTGLPPTIEEIDNFVRDTSANAFEKVVDRLLGTQQYGERMAVMWLDAARYGDTSVYHADGPRDMWAWRDAVVQAYNENVPFDRFSMAQLAADYLPHATLQEQILGGFNRNNGTTDEGGAFAEEYRVEYCVDRVKTTSSIWLGLTLECAQCHDHKYDPISQREYYQFYAFFNASADGGMQTRNGNAKPILEVPDPDREAKLPGVQSELDKIIAEVHQLEQSKKPEFEIWCQAKQAELPQASDNELGLIAKVKLDEGKGRRIGYLPAQEGANRSFGKLVGKANWIKTPRDKGVKFDGGNYIDLGDVADFERSDAFSYGGWLKPKGPVGALLARMDEGSDYRGFDVLLGKDRIEVHLVHQWPDNAIKVVSKQDLKPEQWHHVMVTYDGSSKAAGVRIYVNGHPQEWEMHRDDLRSSIRTKKSLLVGSRHPGQRFQGEIESISVYDRSLSAEEVLQIAQLDAIAELLALAPADRTEEQQTLLRTRFLQDTSPRYRDLTTRREELQGQIVELRKPLTTVMVMRDMDSPRDTFILNRGAYDSPTQEKVLPATPSALPEMGADLPRNRLGLAKWLFDENQTLTARVTVNRYWQMLFGVGLVDTPGDFGAQGSFPTHPQLLDWLAADFRDNGWNVKRTLKQIVMSATYRQSSHASPNEYRFDPKNRWLGRGPRARLPAEFIRDSVLAISGLLDFRMGGPGVKPYQPSGLWVEVGLSGKPAFEQDHGDKLYRRSLYTYWKRSAPPPAMQIFDAPTREKCTLQRPRTNTPLQALVTLNDPQFVEASRKFAESLLVQKLLTDEARLQFAFRQATSRKANESEIKALKKLLQDAESIYRKDVGSTKQLLEVGESQLAAELDPAKLATWTVLCSSLLNLDEAMSH